jgi:hypothetical protein
MFTRIVLTGLASTVSTPAMGAGKLDHRLGVEHVTLAQLEVRVVSRSVPESVSVKIVDGRHLVRVDKPARGVVPMAGTAGDQDLLALERHSAVESGLEACWPPRFAGASVSPGDPDDHRVAGRADEARACGPSTVGRRGDARPAAAACRRLGR